jgi:hypothetical protein
MRALARLDLSHELASIHGRPWSSPAREPTVPLAAKELRA